MKELKMNKHAIITETLLICILLSISTQTKSDDKAGAPTITITKIDIIDMSLELSYEIKNESDQDMWILAGIGSTDVSDEAFMNKDNRTLLIRKRLDVPFGGGNGIPYFRYVLLRVGKTLTESVKCSLPFHTQYGFGDGFRREAQGLEYATRMAIEIGYYTDDLPERIRSVLEKADKIDTAKSDDDVKIKYYFRNSLYYNKISEILRQRDEELLIPYTYQWFKGEQFVRKVAEDVRIPYEEKEDQLIWPYTPDIPTCTRAVIKFSPSMLEYFFPFTAQQSLFSHEEIDFLQSEKTVDSNDMEVLKLLVEDINKGVPLSGIVCGRSVAQISCYREYKLMVSFPIYNDDSVVIDGRYRFVCPITLPGLRRLIPKIQPFELRVNCAANLRNLWHRLRLYRQVKTPATIERSRKTEMASSGKTAMSYPAPSNWCDTLVRVCKTIEMLDEDIIGAHICPGTGEGKKHLARNHYAMNPECKPNSPPDMVLLFETKAGWNQHGGPELFTFDNHDPKGGCVLLNDGTVKFIRTPEELRQLRWK